MLGRLPPRGQPPDRMLRLGMVRVGPPMERPPLDPTRGPLKLGRRTGAARVPLLRAGLERGTVRTIVGPRAAPPGARDAAARVEGGVRPTTVGARVGGTRVTVPARVGGIRDTVPERVGAARATVPARLGGSRVTVPDRVRGARVTEPARDGGMRVAGRVRTGVERTTVPARGPVSTRRWGEGTRRVAAGARRVDTGTRPGARATGCATVPRRGTPR